MARRQTEMDDDKGKGNEMPLVADPARRWSPDAGRSSAKSRQTALSSTALSSGRRPQFGVHQSRTPLR